MHFTCLYNIYIIRYIYIYHFYIIQYVLYIHMFSMFTTCHLVYCNYIFRLLGVYFVLEAVSKLVEEDWEYIPPAESYRAGLLLQQDSTDGFAFSLQLSSLGEVVLVQQQDHRCRGYFPVHQPKDARAWIEQNPNCSYWDFIVGSFGRAVAGQKQDCLNDIATFATLEAFEYAK